MGPPHETEVAEVVVLAAGNGEVFDICGGSNGREVNGDSLAGCHSIHGSGARRIDNGWKIASMAARPLRDASADGSLVRGGGEPA